MESLPTVLLKSGEAGRVLREHPWIYAGSIWRLPQPIPDGAVVQVKDHRFRFLGLGFYNSKSKIQVRILATERVAIGPAFFEQRLRDALAHRQKHLPGATSFRLVNAESDLLSGLIVDKYEEVLVMQTSSMGMDHHKLEIVEVLKRLCAPRAIIERNDMAARKFEGLTNAHGLLYGNLESIDPATTPGLSPSSSPAPITPEEPGAVNSLPEAVPSPAGPSWAPIPVRMNGLHFLADIAGGHKTGLYLDQQVNYQRVAGLAAGARVLDCFCFSGGFSLHAARAGAVHVHGLDQSPEAVALSNQHARLNGLVDQCSFEAANVFDWLKEKTARGPHEKVIPQFDLIILDPPSFTRNRAAVPDALRGYKEIHLRALKLIKPGGVLVTFCCSHHVSAPVFQEVIQEAAIDAHRLLRRIAVFSQSPDHPVIPAIPETEYLKGYAFELIK